MCQDSILKPHEVKLWNNPNYVSLKLYQKNNLPCAHSVRLYNRFVFAWNTAVCGNLTGLNYGHPSSWYLVFFVGHLNSIKLKYDRSRPVPSRRMKKSWSLYRAGRAADLAFFVQTFQADYEFHTPLREGGGAETDNRSGLLQLTLFI